MRKPSLAGRTNGSRHRFLELAQLLVEPLLVFRHLRGDGRIGLHLGRLDHVESRRRLHLALAVVTARLPVPTYARIDLVLDVDNQPCVLEVELIEPSLFLPENPNAAEHVAHALCH